MMSEVSSKKRVSEVSEERGAWSESAGPVSKRVAVSGSEEESLVAVLGSEEAAVEESVGVSLRREEMRLGVVAAVIRAELTSETDAGFMVYGLDFKRLADAELQALLAWNFPEHEDMQVLLSRSPRGVSEFGYFVSRAPEIAMYMPVDSVAAGAIVRAVAAELVATRYFSTLSPL